MTDDVRASGEENPAGRFAPPAGSTESRPEFFPAGDGVGTQGGVGTQTEEQPRWQGGWEEDTTLAAPPPPPRHAVGLGPDWGPPPVVDPPTASGTPRLPSTGLLVVIAVVIALVAGSAGGLGTYLLTRDDPSGIDPDYRLETVSTGTTDRPPESVAGIAARVLPSVVSLEVEGTRQSSSGSGFLIHGGYIVTNNHVVAPAAQGGRITITFHNHKTSEARIVGRDPSSDIAVVKPQDTFGAPEIELGDSTKVLVGDPVIAVGSPLGLAGTVTTGIVSALNRPVTAGGENGSETAWINAIQTDAAINPGNSGGPLVNSSGQVIGINSAIASLGNAFGGQSGNIGLGFAIPSNHVRRIAQELVTTGVAKTSRIGVTLDPQYQGPGVRIATESPQGPTVIPGGPADKAGLKPGDVILQVDGKPVSDGAELIVTIRSKAPGEKVELVYQRDGQEKTVTVTVEATPAQPS